MSMLYISLTTWQSHCGSHRNPKYHNATFKYDHYSWTTPSKITGWRSQFLFLYKVGYSHAVDTFSVLADGRQSVSVWEVTCYSSWRIKLRRDGFALRNDPQNCWFGESFLYTAVVCTQTYQPFFSWDLLFIRRRANKDSSAISMEARELLSRQSSYWHPCFSAEEMGWLLREMWDVTVPFPLRDEKHCTGI